MNKFIFTIFFLILTFTMAWSENINYPFTIYPTTEEVKEKTQREFISSNGREWGSLMVDKFTGTIQFATISGLPGKKNVTDFKNAIKSADNFIQKNQSFLGIKKDFPKCTDIRTSENPQLGYIWLDYSEQYQHNLPVEGTKVMVKVDYPDKVIEIRSRWYEDIKIPEGEKIGEEEVKKSSVGKNINYKGKGGQEMVYITKEEDINEVKKVILPLRKEKENKIEFYLTWKVNINKENIKNAWTFYIDAVSGNEILMLKNFK